MKSYPKRIYLSASWKGDDRALTVQIANLIADCNVTVVRDYEGNKNDDPLKGNRTWVQRVHSMMKDCSGLVVVIPYNTSLPLTTSPFLFPELLIADAQNIPILLFCNPSVVISSSLETNCIKFNFSNAPNPQLLRVKDVIDIPIVQQDQLNSLLENSTGFCLNNPDKIKGPLLYPNSQDHHATQNAIQDFVEKCPTRTPYSFVFNILPFTLKDSVHQKIAREVFYSTGMACHISLDSITKEKSVRGNWQLMMESSDLVIAELSSLRDTCLYEVGCVIGLNKRVFVLSKKGQQTLPFGLDDQSFHQYKSDDLAQYVRETCCSAHRREVFNLSPEFKALHGNKTTLPGVPDWLNQTTVFSFDRRLTVSIWAICLSLALAVQIVVKQFWPLSPTPNMLAVFSAVSGFWALTRVGREYWEKKIGRWLSWLPWVSICSVTVLIVFLTMLIISESWQIRDPKQLPAPTTKVLNKNNS